MKHKFNPNGQAIARITSQILEGIYWTSGSHGVLAPNFPASSPIRFTSTDKMIIKNAVTRLLLTEELNWSALLVIVFKTPTENKLISVAMEFVEFNLTVLGDKLKEIIEVTIRNAIEANSEDVDICEDNLSQYGYFLAPSMDYDFDKMEPSLFEGLNHDCHNYLEWSGRSDYGTKDFINSIAKVKF